MLRSPATPSRVVRLVAIVIDGYERVFYTYGPLFGLILLTGLGGVPRIRRRPGRLRAPAWSPRAGSMLPWATAVALLVFPTAVADFDYRYLLPVLPFACLAVGLAFSPGPAGGHAGAGRRGTGRPLRPGVRTGRLTAIFANSCHEAVANALEAKETDLTTGQSGFMIASAVNGFMNTSPADCSGTPFNFQPEYSSARAQNIIPWGIGPYMINDQFGLGHFEPCNQVVGSAVFTEGTFSDTYYLNCRGPYEKGKEDPNLEPDDSSCYRFGDTHGGTAAPNLVTGCDVFFDAVGDLDWDGTPYYPDWPDSVVPDRFPSTFLQLQPTTNGGHRYPQIQFITDTSASELNTNCDLNSGAGCVLPAQGPGHFFPYWTQARIGGLCLWEFGNMRNGTFGGDAQYGSVGPGTIGAFAGPIRPNPNC